MKKLTSEEKAHNTAFYLQYTRDFRGGYWNMSFQNIHALGEIPDERLDKKKIAAERRRVIYK